MLVFQGKSIIAFTATATLLLVAIFVTSTGDYLAALPYLMWPTAHMAFAFFWMAFSASSLHTLSPSSYSRWAMKNRRYLGLSFAATHIIHLVLILSYITQVPGAGAESSPPSMVPGATAYMFLALMALTSNNAAVKKLGAKNWRKLHLVGGWYIWFIFLARLPELFEGHYRRAWIFAMCITALLLRIKARQKRNAMKAIQPA